MADNWYPKAIKRYIAKHDRNRPSGNYPNALIFHVAVSESSSLYAFFSRAGVCSHFYLRKDGTFEQYIPIDSKSASEKDGNYRTISVETQGGLRNANSEKWTDAQVKALAELAVWCKTEHGIPLDRMMSSKSGETGVGYHRLGINGNFPSDDLYAGRIQRGGGELWSNSRGKICPGNGKISQIPGIIELAKSMAGSETSNPVNPPKPIPKPVPKPTPKPAKGSIETDGIWGKDTTKKLQEVLGTPADGEVSSQSSKWKKSNPGLTSGWQWTDNPKGSQVIQAMQKRLGFTGKSVDGLIGPNTIKALQRRYRTTVDGEIWNPSSVVKAMQTTLNKGKF